MNGRLVRKTTRLAAETPGEGGEGRERQPDRETGGSKRFRGRRRVCYRRIVSSFAAHAPV